MAAFDWPTGLPASPMHQGYAQRQQTATIRSQVGYGPAKVRRRTTAAIWPMNASFRLTGADKDLLNDFYITTLIGGSQRFNWTDPVNGTPVEMRFTAPIQFSSSGPDIWLCVCNFEVMP